MSVFPAHRGGGTISAFETDVQAMQAAGQWLPPDCGGSACTYSTAPKVEDVSVSWSGVGTSASGFSVQRLPAGDTNVKADWKAPAAPTFGQENGP